MSRRYRCSYLFFALSLYSCEGFNPPRSSQKSIRWQEHQFKVQHLLHRQTHPFKARLYASTSLESERLLLAEEIRRTYQESETDGVLKLFLSNTTSQFGIDEVVSATLKAVQGRKGEVASILNALVGSYCLSKDCEDASSRVSDFLEAFDELEETMDINPDIVTYSLAYKASSLNGQSNDLADYILDRASRMSKKLAGGKRRKELAAARRKAISTCSASVDELKSLIGDDFGVLYETDEFVVINKPSGVPCFHNKKTTAGKIKKGKGRKGVKADISLEAALISCNVPLSTLNPEALGMVHRLDRGSSGCMVLAKTDDFHAKLVSEFFLRRTNKKYLTLVTPAPADSLASEGIIDLPVSGRPAKSSYNVLERYGNSAALVEFDIYTGRKHQVRVHAAEGLSAPVAMDDLYSGEFESSIDGLFETNENKQMFFLHSSKLVIPEYGIDVEAPVPSWWEESMEALRQTY